MVIPADVRAALVDHARAESPKEACGLVLLRGGRAERYEPGRNVASSPYRFELEFDDPEIWFAEDDGYELAVFHSHVAAPARPSRTDVENIGLWEGRPYFVYSLQDDDLAAFRIEGGRIAPLPIDASEGTDPRAGVKRSPGQSPGDLHGGAAESAPLR